MGKVIKENPKIVVMKFLRGLLYTLGITAVTYAINFLPNVQFEPEYAFISGILYSILTAIKKSLEKYDPMKDL